MRQHRFFFCCCCGCCYFYEVFWRIIYREKQAFYYNESQRHDFMVTDSFLFNLLYCSLHTYDDEATDLVILFMFFFTEPSYYKCVRSIGKKKLNYFGDEREHDESNGMHL